MVLHLCFLPYRYTSTFAPTVRAGERPASLSFDDRTRGSIMWLGAWMRQNHRPVPVELLLAAAAGDEDYYH